MPGEKWIAGDGPGLGRLRRVTRTRWFGVLHATARGALPTAADALVFPSRTDTFGLVMLEAMACGTPVAAYPVAGPLDVVGDSGAGVLDEDLARPACTR